MAAADLLVVGGTGLLGGELARMAGATGRSVVATFHTTPPPSPADGADVAWVPLDLGDADPIIETLARHEPRAIINAAYVQSGHGLDAVTADAPGLLARWTGRAGARLVHVSSDVVFSGTRREPERETDPVAPITAYGRAKARAEISVADADPAAVVVRTSLLWGGRHGGPQERLVVDPDVTFFTNEVRCPLRVDRLATAILELVDRPTITGVLHVAGADAVDRLTFARLLARRLGTDPQTLRGVEDTSGTRPNHIVLDSSRARELLAAPLPGARTDLS